MNLKIQHLEQAQDDHEFLKYDFEKKKEKINALENNLDITQMQIEMQNTMYEELNDKYDGKKMLCDAYANENLELHKMKKLKNLEILILQMKI